jgi:hypothetical protein
MAQRGPPSTRHKLLTFGKGPLEPVMLYPGMLPSPSFLPPPFSVLDLLSPFFHHLSPPFSVLDLFFPSFLILSYSPFLF